PKLRALTVGSDAWHLIECPHAGALRPRITNPAAAGWRRSQQGRQQQDRQPKSRDEKRPPDRPLRSRPPYGVSSQYSRDDRWQKHKVHEAERHRPKRERRTHENEVDVSESANECE